ncbi:hypothetical protein [Sorangium sp. So ce388]|uniref:hypothetical protein n=1 Tax=Sorangium sp. So ce388 TaxID=3133309 RepID=UPI003F5C4780
MNLARSSSAPRVARRGLRMAAKLLAVLAGVASMSIATSAEAQPKPPTSEPVTTYCTAAASPKVCADKIAKAIEGKLTMAAQWHDALNNKLEGIPAGVSADSRQQAQAAVKGAQDALAKITRDRVDAIRKSAASAASAEEAQKTAKALYTEYLGFVAMWTTADEAVKVASTAPTGAGGTGAGGTGAGGTGAGGTGVGGTGVGGTGVGGTGVGGTGVGGTGAGGTGAGGTGAGGTGAGGIAGTSNADSVCANSSKGTADCIDAVLSEARVLIKQNGLKAKLPAGLVALEQWEDVARIEPRVERAEEELEQAQEAVDELEAYTRPQEPSDSDKQKVLKYFARVQGASNALAAATQLAAAGKETLEICAKQCLSPGAFCIDAQSGEPFCEGLSGATYDPPDSLRPGARIAVRVIGKEAEDAGKVKLALNFATSPEFLFNQAADQEALRRGLGALTVVEQQIVQVPDDSTIAFLRIVFARTDGQLRDPVEYQILVDHGQYYLEAGVLLPIVVDGSRRVVTTPIPSTGGERMYSIAENWSVNPSIVLNVFPGGRRRGFVSSYQGCFWCAGFWGDFLGLQAGVDLDLGKPFDRIFMGVVLQPVAGLSINSGLALVEQEFLPPGYAVGMPVTSGETLTPQPRYMPRFYFGATLTLDIVNTVATATREAQKLF